MSSYTPEDVVRRAKQLLAEHGDYEAAASHCRTQQAWADEPGWTGEGADYWRDVAGVLTRVAGRLAGLEAAAASMNSRDEPGK